MRLSAILAVMLALMAFAQILNGDAVLAALAAFACGGHATLVLVEMAGWKPPVRGDDHDG